MLSTIFHIKQRLPTAFCSDTSVCSVYFRLSMITYFIIVTTFVRQSVLLIVTEAQNTCNLNLQIGNHIYSSKRIMLVGDNHHDSLKKSEKVFISYKFSS